MNREAGTRIQMRQVWRSLSWVLLLAVTGCDRAPISVAHTVSYFREHEDERHETLRRCDDDPGTLAQTPECVNAREANLVENTESYRKIPPLGLPPQAHMRAGAPTSDRP